MVKSRGKIMSWRPNDKTRAYFIKLGLIDARSGTKKKDGTVNINQFINVAVQKLCESGGISGHMATLEELERSWIKYQASSGYVEICKLKENIRKIELQINNVVQPKNVPRNETKTPYNSPVYTLLPKTGQDI